MFTSRTDMVSPACSPDTGSYSRACEGLLYSAGDPTHRVLRVCERGYGGRMEGEMQPAELGHGGTRIRTVWVYLGQHPSPGGAVAGAGLRKFLVRLEVRAVARNNERSCLAMTALSQDCHAPGRRLWSGGGVNNGQA